MFLDTANLKEIKKYSKLNWIAGVTTNPSLLIKENDARDTIFESIISILNGKKLFIQVEGKNYKEMKEDAYHILNRFPEANIGLKIQADNSGYELIDHIKKAEKKCNVLATVIFSVEQAYLSALSGADWIAPYINRMANASIDPLKIIRDTKKVYSQHEIQTKIMGASFKNQGQVINSLLNGTDTVTVSAKTLDGILNNPLAKESIKVFNQHAEERKKYET